VAECLSPQKSKDEVKLFALGIIRNFVKLLDTSIVEQGSATQDSMIPTTQNELLVRNIDHFLIQIGDVLRNQQDVSKDLLEGCVETVSELAPFVTTSKQVGSVFESF
jgi:U3 small nucleolar RNA-associated protein 20